MPEWWENSMSDYGSASDQFYGAGGQPVSSYTNDYSSMPMDPGPAYQDWGSYNVLAGQDQGMGGGRFMQQPDPMMQSFQYGMNQTGGVDQAYPTSEIQPSGGGSWFKKLLSSTILGMAAGAGAPDAATAFSSGYAAVQQQRQQEAMMMQQQKQMQQQEYMAGLDRTKKNLELMKLAQDIEMAPIELQMKQAERDEMLFKELVTSGERPIRDFPATLEGMAEATKIAQQNGENMLSMGYPVEHAGRIYVFPAQSQTMTPPNYSIQIGDTNVPFGNQPWSDAFDKILQGKKMDLDKWQTMFREQQENARALGYQKVTARGQDLRPTAYGPEWAQPGNLTDAQKSQIYEIDAELAPLRIDPIRNKDRIAELTKQRATIIGGQSGGQSSAIDYSRPVTKDGRTGYMQPNGQVYIP